METSLNTPVRYLKGVGPKRAASLNNLGVYTVEDFFYYFPRRYEDRTNFLPIAKLQEGEFQTIKAEVMVKGERRSFRRQAFRILEVVVSDGSGKISCVWFNQPYLREYFFPGASLILYGKVERYAGKLQMHSPDFEVVPDKGDESLNIGRIVPVYPLPKGIGQRQMRGLIKQVIDGFIPSLKDHLPPEVLLRNDLLGLSESFLNIHFPESFQMQSKAFRRLSFDEFLFFQLPLILRKLSKKQKMGISHHIKGNLIKEFISALPFSLTKAQQKVIREIALDMSKPVPMQRLLQGDVGSGKTVVAEIASAIAIQGGFQAAFMAPTEILARQHQESVSRLFAELLYDGRRIRVELLCGSTAKAEKDAIYQDITEGKIDLLIGTHALLEEGVNFKNLGLVVIDEQHKFGVGQRALLPSKGPNPDILIMTATPIPRTLAITLYGDLDVSLINELPPGRPVVKTLSVNQDNLAQAYELMKNQLRQGFQGYIVYPVIEESFAMDIAGAKKMYAQLKAGEFKDFKVGLVHGKLKPQETKEVMDAFRSRELDILVSTTVLEVGIDIPNATCMIIEHAERFGLSQLHQLRGRIGRGRQESFCVLVSQEQTENAKARIEAMVKYGDGFSIAEEDLRIRGPGEFFGRRQHGLSELKIGNPLTQMHLLKLAREEAVKLLNLDQGMRSPELRILREKLLQRFPEYEKLMIVG